MALTLGGPSRNCASDRVAGPTLVRLGDAKPSSLAEARWQRSFRSTVALSVLLASAHSR